MDNMPLHMKTTFIQSNNQFQLSNRHKENVSTYVQIHALSLYMRNSSLKIKKTNRFLDSL